MSKLLFAGFSCVLSILSSAAVAQSNDQHQTGQGNIGRDSVGRDRYRDRYGDTVQGDKVQGDNYRGATIIQGNQTNIGRDQNNYGGKAKRRAGGKDGDDD